MAATVSVVKSSDTIIPPQTSIPKIGTNGTNGVLNGRSKVGSDLRSKIIATQTNTKANNVPNDVKSPATLPGTNAANAPTKANKIQFDLNGVLYFG